MAANGALCTNGYSTHPYCSPSRAAILTGRYQQRFGHEGGPEVDSDDALQTAATSLASLVREAGAPSVAAIVSPHLTNEDLFALQQLISGGLRIEQRDVAVVDGYADDFLIKPEKAANARGARDLGLLTLDDVERIEIVRGPASVLYGSDAVAGVVQIFTRRGGAKASGAADARGGSYGSYDVDASLGVPLGSARLAVGTGHHRSCTLPMMYRFGTIPQWRLSELLLRWSPITKS